MYRYFGSAEGSKFVEAGSAENVKRTWVDYGLPREWTNPTQGQVSQYTEWAGLNFAIPGSSFAVLAVVLSTPAKAASLCH